jgi:hypothetical protein
MAAENCLWGAPRIHGELLKLGIAISERTVSRYLRGRPTTRSQTWRTFFANHLGDRPIISPVMFADAHDDDIGVDASDLSFRPAPSIDGSCTSLHGPNVDWGRSLQHSSLGLRLGQNHLQDRTGARQSGGRDPPRHLPWQPTSRPPGRFSLVRAHSASATDGTTRSFARACLPIAVRSLLSVCDRVVNVVGRPNTSFGPRRGCLRRDSHGDRNIGEAQGWR